MCIRERSHPASLFWFLPLSYTSQIMDTQPMEKQTVLMPTKQRVSKDYFHLTECARKQAEIKACREAWMACPHYLWMDVLRALDVRTYRRLSRVSREWQNNLQAVPQINKGIFCLDLATKFEFLRFKEFFPSGFRCFEHKEPYGYGSRLVFSPGRCQYGTHCQRDWGRCQFRSWGQAQNTKKKQRFTTDYEWWAEVFGVPSLTIVKKVHYRTIAYGAQPLKVWLGIEASAYKHTLWRARGKQIVKELGAEPGS